METRKLVYNSIVAPNFDCCASLYIGINNEHKNRLQKLQNRAMRSIIRCEYRTSRILMLNTLKWISVSERQELITMLMIFKLRCGMLPEYMSEDVNFVQNASGRELRNGEHFRIQRRKKECNKKNLFYLGLKKYNEIPTHIKSSRNVKEFKQKLYIIII